MPKQKSYNPVMENCILSTAYFPPIEYFAAMANSQRVLVEKCETFQKQSYRTRCHIYSANGLLALTIPVKRDTPVLGAGAADGETDVLLKPSHKLLIDKIEIDYSKPWVQQHKRAIEAAYSTTPFFEYYKDDIFALLDSGEPYLFNLNMQIIELMRELIGISVPMEFTTEWVLDYSTGSTAKDYRNEADSFATTKDFRGTIHPKFKGDNLLKQLQIEKPYYQVFSGKQGFIPNLSILDLLCNEGPNSISFLKAYSKREQ